MKLLVLSGKITWFGKHSGYEALTDYLPNGMNVEIVQSGNTLIGRTVGKILQVFFKWTYINTQDIFTEMKFVSKINPKKIAHILYIEGHIQLIEKINKKRKSLIGTIHLPISQWSKESLGRLNKFEHTINLYEKEILLFAKYIPLNKIHFIRHGISLEFFKPHAKKDFVIKNRILIVGHFLRNFEMLLEVYSRISVGFKEIEFHVIIPSLFRDTAELVQMAKGENVFFYEKLSDEELLEQYQQSNVLLIPMTDSGANTAIVQALAVGLPVITTDVGGIRSYGGGEIFPLVDNNDVDGMVSLFTKYYDNKKFRDDIAKKQRRYAMEFLDWNMIAKQHIDYYQSINQ